MKILVLTAALFSQLAFANGLGQKVNIYTDSSGPRMGTLFANDSDKVWIMNLSLWAPDLAVNKQIKTLAWNLYDAKTGKYLRAWSVALNGSSPAIYPGTMGLSLGIQTESEIVEAIAALPNLKLVLSVDQSVTAPVPTHFVDIGSYCGPYPALFMNLTTGKAGCKSN